MLGRRRGVLSVLLLIYIILYILWEGLRTLRTGGTQDTEDRTDAGHSRQERWRTRGIHDRRDAGIEEGFIQKASQTVLVAFLRENDGPLRLCSRRID